MPRKKAAPAAQDPADADPTLGIQQYELPKATVTRLAKSAVPPETKLQKDVPLALVKGSTIFINYLSALAHDTAVDQGHKTITAAHVLEAVKQLGWEDTGDLSKLLKRELKAFRLAAEAKKNGTSVPRVAAAAATTTASTSAVAAAGDDGTADDLGAPVNDEVMGDEEDDEEEEEEEEEEAEPDQEEDDGEPADQEEEEDDDAMDAQSEAESSRIAESARGADSRAVSEHEAMSSHDGQ